jgi:chromosome partitioning protein
MTKINAKILDRLRKKPIVISFLNQKGGSGKTTLSTNVAHGLILKGLKTILIDTDPQKSALDWYAAMPKEEKIVPVIGIDPRTIDSVLPSITSGYNVVVIDGSGKVTGAMSSIVVISDVILIPINPTQYDVWASADLVKIIREQQALNKLNYRDGPKAEFVINRDITATQNIDASRARTAAKEYKIDLLTSKTMQRIEYFRGLEHGFSVFTKRPNKAADEMECIVDEIIEKYIVK